MKLNMGCGNNKMEGWVNVDMFSECSPDVVCNLESIPWIWETSSATEVKFHHSLEHMGADSKLFLSMMKELYRVCAPGCIVRITVPHPRHDNFINDPTHVRAISPNLMALFSKRMNAQWKREHGSNTPLATYLDVDFDITEVTFIVDEPYLSLYQSKKISDNELSTMIKERNNIVSEYQMVLTVIK